MFASQFGRYRFTRLPLILKIDEIFKGLPNTFDIADDNLIVGYDPDVRDCGKTLR